MQSLTEYMKKELVFYIKQERDKGVPLSQIKKSLLSGGHHTNLVKEAMRSLKKHNYNLVKALNEPIKSSLDKELYFNIMNSLVKYVEYQLAAGKTEKDIRKILSDYGHSKDVIEKAMKGMKTEEVKIKPYTKYIDICFTALFFIMIFVVSGLAKEPIEIVALGFSPTILTIIMLNASITNKNLRKYFWVYAVAFSFLFLIIGMTTLVELNMEFFRLMVLNIILSFFYTYIKSARTVNVEEYLEKLQESVSTDSDTEMDKEEKKRDNKSKSNKSGKKESKKDKK